MKEKIKPNVLVLAGLVTIITGALLWGMFNFLSHFTPETEFWDGAVVGSVITLFVTIVGVAIGGLVTTMSTVAQDTPPPTVPASTHEWVVEYLAEKED